MFLFLLILFFIWIVFGTASAIRFLSLALLLMLSGIAALVLLITV